MIPSRRCLFALLGFVLPVAAFTASPVSAASTLHHNKPHKAHATSAHKAKPHHAKTQRVAHHGKHTPAHKVTPS